MFYWSACNIDFMQHILRPFASKMSLPVKVSLDPNLSSKSLTRQRENGERSGKSGKSEREAETQGNGKQEGE